MRIKYDKISLDIILKEEPILYFDEDQQFRLRPLEVYYSEKGDLAKIVISNEEKENEVLINDCLPWRKYVYTRDKKTYGCIDRYADITNTEDIFMDWGHLMIQRRDGMEMDKDEIKGIREDFLKDASVWFSDLLLHDKVISVSKNRRLYFWVTKERMNGDLEFVQDTFEVFLGYENGELKKRNIGVDLIYPDHQLALICIYDYEYFYEHDNERVITKEELIDIMRKTKKYENRRIILLYTELSEKAIEYAKSQNIEIQELIDVVKEKFMLESMWNDDVADELDISDIFGDNHKDTFPGNKKPTDKSRKEKHKKPIDYPESSNGSFILKDSRPFGPTKES